jgi:hypothetical protein
MSLDGKKKPFWKRQIGGNYIKRKDEGCVRKG